MAKQHEEKKQDQDQENMATSVSILYDWDRPNKLRIDETEKDPGKDYYYALKDSEGMIQANRRGFVPVDKDKFTKTNTEFHDLRLCERPIEMKEEDDRIKEARTELMTRSRQESELREILRQGGRAVGKIEEMRRGRSINIPLNLQKGE